MPGASRLDGRYQCVPAFFVSVQPALGSGACYDPGACYDGTAGSRHRCLCAREILHGFPDPCRRRHRIQQAVCTESGCGTVAFQMPKGEACHGAEDAEFSALQSGSAELRTKLETLQPDISALKNIRKYIDMVLNKQQLSAPGGKTPEKESVLKKLEEAKAAQTTKKTEAKNHTQEL